MKICTEVDLDLQKDISRRIYDAMNDATDYDMLVAIMSAHVQRMICNEAGNRPVTAILLLKDFQQICSAKVQNIIDLPQGRAA